MGTRALVNVIEDDKVLCTIYRQYDGYPEGLGKELEEFLEDFTIVNGFSSETPKPVANGMGCLAAQLIKHLKDGVGNVYIFPINSKDVGEEFMYNIKENKGKVKIECIEVEYE